MRWGELSNELPKTCSFNELKKLLSSCNVFESVSNYRTRFSKRPLLNIVTVRGTYYVLQGAFARASTDVAHISSTFRSEVKRFAKAFENDSG